jgi:hypothetical protein
MQNIDPVYFLTPVVVIAFSFGAVAYWHGRRRLTVFALLFSLVAYFGAILAKAVVHSFTYRLPLFPATGASPFEVGAYFGLQTVVFEVGGAYLVARYAVSRGMMRANDAEGYGISLALWENGVLLGGLLLVSYAIYYATLSAGSGAAAQQMLAALLESAPALFDPPSSALPLVGYAILERVSSLMVHFSWGYLCVLAAVLRKRTFLILALPMGLVDFFAAFEGPLGTAAFEALIFVIAVMCVAVALASTKGKKTTLQVKDLARPTAEPGTPNLGSLFLTNFKRSLNFGRIYLLIGMFLPLLFAVQVSAAGGAAGSLVLDQLYPLILPVFVVLGSLGALMIFSSDKEKGVYEYLIAYGLNPSTIFWSIIVATMGIVVLVLAVSLAVTTGALLLMGGVVSVRFAELLLFYTIPLSFASTMFMSMAGMIWSQLTTRVAGVNSPAGIAPLLGIAPVLAVFFAATQVPSGDLLYLVGAVSVAMIWAVVVMASVASRRMQRERFLSNA